MYYMNGYHYRNELHAKLHEFLIVESDKRDQVPGVEWVELERKAMWERVNKERADRGKKPLDIKDVQRVEMMAMGHTDYGTKFALYCTELVEDKP